MALFYQKLAVTYDAERHLLAEKITANKLNAVADTILHGREVQPQSAGLPGARG